MSMRHKASGNARCDFASLGADLMSLSSHKVYGPKGVGALVISQRGDSGGRGRVQLTALQFGGGQERALAGGDIGDPPSGRHGSGIRVGREDALRSKPRALHSCSSAYGGDWPRSAGVLRNGSATRSVPHLLNVSFEGVEGESLLAAIRPHVAVSTGSACTSALAEPSYVLRALGRSERLSESSLRFGLGRTTTEEDIDTAVATLALALSRLRKVAGATPVS